MSGQKPLKLAIVGGGIGGMSLALCLNKLITNHESHLEIEIYESANSLKAQVGAGIGVWPFAWVVFEELGIADELLTLALKPPTEEPVELLRLRKSDQAEGRDLFTLTTSSGRNVQFHRGDFQAILAKHLPSSVKIHLQKRLETYTQNESGVTLQFKDGSTAYADIVVGSDGLQSRVRRKLVDEIGKGPNPHGHPSDAYWTGLIIYRDLIPREEFVKQGFPNHPTLAGWTTYTGPGGNARIMAYPVSNGALVNIVATKSYRDQEGSQYQDEVMRELLRKEGYEREPVKTATVEVKGNDSVVEGDVWSETGGETVNGKRQRWFTRVSPDEVRHHYKGWEPEVQAIMNGLGSPIAWAIHGVGKLETYSHGRVCLLGDAAHALQPQHAAGAAVAILDAYILAHLFNAAIRTDATKLSSKVNVLLDIYDKLRRPGAQHVAAASRASNFGFDGLIQEADGKWRAINPDSPEDVKRLQDILTNDWSYAWDKTLTPRAVEAALKSLKEQY